MKPSAADQSDPQVNEGSGDAEGDWEAAKARFDSLASTKKLRTVSTQGLEVAGSGGCTVTVKGCNLILLLIM